MKTTLLTILLTAILAVQAQYTIERVENPIDNHIIFYVSDILTVEGTASTFFTDVLIREGEVAPYGFFIKSTNCTMYYRYKVTFLLENGYKLIYSPPVDKINDKHAVGLINDEAKAQIQVSPIKYVQFENLDGQLVSFGKPSNPYYFIEICNILKNKTFKNVDYYEFINN